MHAETFLKEFAPLANSPGGVQKLRELVLNLAISGRLSDRRPDDGHAAALVESARIAINEAIKSGKIRKPKYFEKMAAGEPDTRLPASWVYSKLGDLGLISPRNEAPGQTVAGFVPMAAIEAKFGLPHSFEERQWADIKSGHTHVANRDVVLAKITPCFENGKSTEIAKLPSGIGAGTTELHVFRQPAHVVEPGYVLAFLKSESFIQSGIPKMTGTAGQKRIPTEYFALSPFPLPPLAEQKRIVAKVSELMALCDDLEARQQEGTGMKLAATASALHHLTEAKTPEETATRWSLIAPTFGELFDDLEAIKALRGAVLDMLIYAPASYSKDLDTRPLDKFATSITDGDHLAPPKSNSGIPFLVISNVVGGSVRVKEATRFVSREYFSALKPERKPKRGDLLYTVTGSIGIPVIVDTELEFCFQRHIAIIKPSCDTDPRYLYYALQSDRAKQQALQVATGTAQKTIPLSGLRKIRIPFREIQDQNRIVAKVDELMALCDLLKGQVSEGKRLNAELMASLVHSLTEADPDGGGPAVGSAKVADATLVLAALDAANDESGERSESTNVRPVRTWEAEKRNVQIGAVEVDTRFKEAVLVGAIVKAFFDKGGEPIGNFRLQKAVYFARRHNGEHVDRMDYLKKAAGPYSPSMKYTGGIAIAKQKEWLHEARGRFGFGHIPGATAGEMDDWIAKYGYDESARWVAEHFRFKKNEEWETLATIDYAIEHLQSVGIEPDGAQILQYIRSDDEWRPKIEKLSLTEMSIEAAIVEVTALFATTGADGSA